MDTSKPVVRSAQNLARMIDHTGLKPETTRSQVLQLCDEAKQLNTYSVCVNPVFVPLVAKALKGSPVLTCAVVGFPLGATTTATKMFEALEAIQEGAQELDMVIHVGALIAGADDEVRRDIQGVSRVCKEGGAILKVILETCLLSEKEKITACTLAMESGADFVKTSTGFSSGGATVEDILLMSKTVASHQIGVKASGGIRTLTDVLRMIDAGATRIGCSHTVKILDEARLRFV